MAKVLHKVFRNVGRLRKMPVIWKTAAVFPVFKKGDGGQVEKDRPKSLLNFVGEIFEKCIYQSLYDHFPNSRNSDQWQPICLSLWNNFMMLWTKSHQVKSSHFTLIFQRLLTKYGIWSFWKSPAKSALGAAILKWYPITSINVSTSCVWIIQSRNFWMLQAAYLGCLCWDQVCSAVFRLLWN